MIRGATARDRCFAPGPQDRCCRLIRIEVHRIVVGEVRGGEGRPRDSISRSCRRRTSRRHPAAAHKGGVGAVCGRVGRGRLSTNALMAATYRSGLCSAMVCPAASTARATTIVSRQKRDCSSTSISNGSTTCCRATTHTQPGNGAARCAVTQHDGKSAMMSRGLRERHMAQPSTVRRLAHSAGVDHTVPPVGPSSSCSGMPFRLPARIMAPHADVPICCARRSRGVAFGLLFCSAAYIGAAWTEIRAVDVVPAL
jgi:hypothetical protein